MRDVSREKPWMCAGYGYVMDAFAPAGSTRRPKAAREDDLALCLNCGWVHVRHGARWVPITAAERAALLPDEREDLALAEQARAATHRHDLARGQGGRAS